MADQMRADVSGLRDIQPQVRFLTSSVAATLNRLAAGLDAEGACWGSDQMGEAFGRSYAPAAQQVRDACALLRDGLGGVGDALLQVASNVDAVEGRAQARLDTGGQ